MGDYQRLNVLNQKDIMSDDAIKEVANLINSHSVNRGQKRRLEKALNKTKNIYAHAQKRVDNRAYKAYEEAVDENMRRFFAVLGIVLVKNYGWSTADDNDQVWEMYDILNTYLKEYQQYDTDTVAKICEEVTGYTLVKGD